MAKGEKKIVSPFIISQQIYDSVSISNSFSVYYKNFSNLVY